MDSLTSLLPAISSTSTTCLAATAASLILVFSLTGSKNLPLAYTVRLLPSLYRILKPRYSSSSSSTSRTRAELARDHHDEGLDREMVAQERLFAHHTTTTRAYLPEIDINLHKSNSTFFVDADVSRAELLTSLLSNGLSSVSASHSTITNPETGKKRIGKPKPAMFLLAGVSAKFLRPIAPLEGYEVSSRILSWEEGPRGALYVVTYFFKVGTSKKLGNDQAQKEIEVEGGPAAVLKDETMRKKVYAVMVTRYVFKAGREGVSPGDVLRAAGLLMYRTGRAAIGEKKGEKGEEQQKGWMDAENVKKAVENGREYIASCI